MLNYASKTLHLDQQYGQAQYGQGMGQYGQGMGQYGQGMGQYGQGGMGQYGSGQYGAYYNQYPGSNSFYSGSSGMNNYNRPGNSYGGGSGGYFWNAADKQQINLFTVFFSSILALAISLIAI